MTDDKNFALSCPTPLANYEQILLAHGGGGKLMHQLLESVILPALDNVHLQSRHDASVFVVGNQKLAFTTDSYVVSPLFFAGGDIGTLAINGTVNDLAMAGARPLYLSLGLILEEGLPVETLSRVMASIKKTAAEADVQIITGDTKVVDRGKGDGIFINTAGIGVVEHSLNIVPGSVRPGDAIILSGDIGRHGIAIMAQRAGLQFETTIESDCAPLHLAVQKLLAGGIDVHCLRDLTRGGLASALTEVAQQARLGIHITETPIAVCEPVRSACELLGLDPLYVANEGRFVAFVPEIDAERALAILRKEPVCQTSALIGSATVTDAGLVLMTSTLGSTRIVDMLSGEQLPRIC
jgi:hydrogenase expression/formation protein HypE